MSSSTVKAMLESPRCGARTRVGGSCASPAVSGKKRCRMHGGAAGSGAPKGNRNAWKHGYFTKEEIVRRREENKRWHELTAVFYALKAKS